MKISDFVGMFGLAAGSIFNPVRMRITKQVNRNSHNTKKGPGRIGTIARSNSEAGTKFARDAASGMCTLRGRVRSFRLDV